MRGIVSDTRWRRARLCLRAHTLLRETVTKKAVFNSKIYITTRDVLVDKWTVWRVTAVRTWRTPQAFASFKGRKAEGPDRCYLLSKVSLLPMQTEATHNMGRFSHLQNGWISPSPPIPHRLKDLSKKHSGKGFVGTLEGTRLVFNKIPSPSGLWELRICPLCFFVFS